MKGVLSVVVLLVACGRTPLTLPGSGDEAAPPLATASPDPIQSGCEVTPPVCGDMPFEPVSHYRCSLDEAAPSNSTLVAILTSAALHLVRNGPAPPLEVHQFSAIPDDATWTTRREVIVRGDRIAALRALYPWQGNGSTIELVIVDSAGRTILAETHQFEQSPSSIQIFGNTRGHFVFRMSFLDETVHRIVDSAEGRTWSEPFSVSADPTTDGWVLVDDSLEFSTVDFDWYHLVEATRRPSCYRLRPSYWDVHLFSPGIVYALPEAGEIVYERGDERCRMALPDAWPLGHEWPRMLASNRAGWTLTGWVDDGMHVIPANVASGVSLPAFRLIVPEDHDPPKYFESDTLRAALVDHEGATVLSLTRTDSAGELRGGVFRTFDGVAWELLGNEQVLVPEVANGRSVTEAGGTYLFSSRRPGGPGHQRDPFTQVIRPASGLTLDLPRDSSQLTVSEDGRCIASFDSDQRLELLDLTTGTSHLGPAFEGGGPIAFVPAPVQ